MDIAAASTHVSSAVRASYAAFIGAGFGFASWASRIPEVKAHLQLSPAELGLVLLAIAAGSVLALPSAGLIVHRIGTRRTVTAMAVVFAVALVVAGVGQLAGVVPLVVGLFVLGFANGAWDVAMNVQAADVERRLGSSIMSRFHAGFSLGTVAGALLGALMIALAVPVAVHLSAVAVIIAVVVPLLVRAFLPDVTPPAASDGGRRGAALTRWREPRTLVIGVFVLAFAFAEGSANDWITVALVDGYHATKVVATLGFAVFLAAMTAARWIGTTFLDKYGRVRVVRCLAMLALAGLLLFVLAPDTPLALLGALMWGAGASLGFPVGMSAAADDPVAAAARVSVVASIGYCAFLGGPPLIGFLGSHVGIRHALLAVAALLALATALAPALRGPGAVTPATSGDGR